MFSHVIIFICLLFQSTTNSIHINNHKKHIVTTHHHDNNHNDDDVACKNMKTYGDCELLDVVLTKAANRHIHNTGTNTKMKKKIHHKCMWCKRGVYDFCTSCANLENLEGDGVMCQPFVRDKTHLCNREIDIHAILKQKQRKNKQDSTTTNVYVRSLQYRMSSKFDGPLAARQCLMLREPTVTIETVSNTICRALRIASPGRPPKT